MGTNTMIWDSGSIFREGRGGASGGSDMKGWEAWKEKGLPDLIVLRQFKLS